MKYVIMINEIVKRTVEAIGYRSINVGMILEQKQVKLYFRLGIRGLVNYLVNGLNLLSDHLFHPIATPFHKAKYFI